MRGNGGFRNNYNNTQKRMLAYLKCGVKRGEHYFKARYIAKDLGLSSKEVGANLAILADMCEELEITRWSYSNATTWLVRQQTAV